jgi:hypothetical protein
MGRGPSQSEVAALALAQVFPALKDSSEDAQQVAQLLEYIVDVGLPLVRLCLLAMGLCSVGSKRSCHDLKVAVSFDRNASIANSRKNFRSAGWHPSLLLLTFVYHAKEVGAERIED